MTIVEAHIPSGDYGVFSAENSCIYLDPAKNANPIVERDTLLHELLHALCLQTGLVLRFEEEVNNKFEEEVVRALSTALLEMLRRNPKLVAYLVG